MADQKNDDNVDTSQRSTMRMSQDEQARGYLESLIESEGVRELQNALSSAERITKKEWTVLITTDAVEIRGGDQIAKKAKKPKTSKKSKKAEKSED